MTHDDIMTTASHYSEVDAQGYVKFCEDDLINFAQAILARAIAQPAEQTRALTMDEGELDEFDRTVTDFEDDGETSTDYNLLMDWAQRGFLECTHFEVTKAGQDLLTAARPASGETE